MDALSEIRRSIKNMAAEKGTCGMFTAKVVSVNGDRCTVETDGLKLSDVQLRAVVNGENSKVLLTPKTNSYVLVADTSGNMTNLIVTAYSEVDKIEVDCEEIVINGGENGIVKIDELHSRLSALESKFNSHTHSVSTTGNATAQSGTAAQIIATSSEFQNGYEGYEDKKVKH